MTRYAIPKTIAKSLDKAHRSGARESGPELAHAERSATEDVDDEACAGESKTCDTVVTEDHEPLPPPTPKPRAQRAAHAGPEQVRLRSSLPEAAPKKR